MSMSMSQKMAALVVASLLTGCSAFDRISDIGSGPSLSTIENPQDKEGYHPVSMPMPTPQSSERMPNSLWQAGSRAFFRDQRAGKVGDILTVIINISDKAQLKNETKRARTNSDTANLNKFMGLENRLNRLLPNDVAPSSLVDMGSKTSNDGSGSIDRNESISLRVAAVINQVLPNGNLVLNGKQEILVNQERRDLYISGVIRPEDISSANSINYDQIAEARISYGGHGQVSDFQQPRYGEQLFDVIFPF